MMCRVKELEGSKQCTLWTSKNGVKMLPKKTWSLCVKISLFTQVKVGRLIITDSIVKSVLINHLLTKNVLAFQTSVVLKVKR